MKYSIYTATLILTFFCVLFFSSCNDEKENASPYLEPSEEFFALRSYPDAFISVKSYEKALHQAKEQALLKSSGFDQEWTTQGPANIGARINTIAAHPTDANIIYVGFSGGGVWKTTDGGEHWIPLFDEQLFLSIGDIEIDPNDHNTIYVGTGDPNISGYPFIGGGVYKSTDAGVTWQHLGLADTRITSRILVSPTNSNHVYVATMGLPFEPTTERGVYFSADGGATWEQQLMPSQTAGIIDMVMNPQNPSILYAAGWNRVRTNQVSIVTGSEAKIWKTTDGGINWTILAGGLPIEDNLGRIGLAMSQQNPDKIYAQYVGESSQLHGIYKTENGGENWTTVPTYSNDQEDDLTNFALGGFGWYFGKIRVDENDDNHIFLCGVDLWETNLQNNDADWSKATPPWWSYDVHADKHDLTYDAAGNILLATDGGLYRKSTNNNEWSDIENIPCSQFYRVAYNPHITNSYYGGMQDNGTSGGNITNINDWPRIYGGDGFQPAFHPDMPNLFFAETQRGGIVLSEDNGLSFSGATDGIDFEDRKNWDMPYMLSYHNPNNLYTGTYRAYTGTLNNNNVVWQSVSEDLTDGNIYGNTFHTISALDESHFTEGELYYGSSDGNVWRLEGADFTPVNITAGLPDRYVTSIKTSPSLPNTIYVTHSGYKNNEFTPRLHRSDDKGNTWTDISGDLPDLAINDIFIETEGQDSILFVATDGGVYGTTNLGENWQRVGTNMPFIPVYDLEKNIAKNELIAGTYARSIMTYSLDSVGIELPVDTTNVAINTPKYAPLKIYPSPATSYVQVEFSQVEEGRSFDLIILDTSGKIMYRQHTKQDGLNNVKVNIQNYPSGTYFVKVKFRHTLLSGSFVVNG